MTAPANESNVIPAPLNPVHLRSTKEIAQVFGVKAATVRHWRELGAPIVLLGKKYQANYQDLWQWLKSRAIESDTENA